LPGDVAPPWHTAALVLVIVGVAIIGTLTSRGAAPGPAPASLVVTAYVPMLVAQLGLALYVCRIGRGRNALSSIVGRRWTSASRAWGDLALAAAAWCFIEVTEAAMATFRPAHNAAVLVLLPHTPTERCVWMAIAVAAGFCEEVVYRGYLQNQFMAFTRSAAVAVGLQAVLFGVAHADQGPSIAVRFGLYGVGLGALAWWRGSLIPGIAAHVGVDVATGWLARG
jgi:membrane protease YdiL (CAAX protease family)